MKKTLKAFMSGLIDYAGLFPPTRLDMDTAIHNFAEYRSGDYSFMLSNFICPADKLGELNKYKDELFSKNPPFRFSVICNCRCELPEFTKTLTEHLENIEAFYEHQGNRIKVTTLEIRLPEFGADKQEVHRLLNQTVRRVNNFLPNDVQVFFEMTMDDLWKENATALVEALSEHNSRMTNNIRYIRGGFKLRCGGVTPDLIPDSEKVSTIIDMCNRHQVPMKFTAGLHHPVRHKSSEMGTKQHGFFNIFSAAILAHTYQSSEKSILEVIEDENLGHFRFDDTFFAWKKFKVTAEGISKARMALACSFGSCSFDEPVEDLKKADLMINPK
jgi:hypothetical protein